MHRVFLIYLITCAISVKASMDFYGYKETVVNDSLIQYNQVLLGTTELENSEITVTPRGSYLDVIEDGWISSDVTKLNLLGLTGDYLMKGSIPVPQEATIVGLQTWRGLTMYRAGLHETKYITDFSYTDSTALKKSIDSRIALLQKHTDVHYELTLTRIGLGEKTHVRLRYLLRIGSTRSTYVIPVLFHSVYGKTPKNIKFKVYADNFYNKFVMISGESKIILSDTSTNIIPYHTAINLQLEKSNSSTMNITEFTSDPYRGHYMLVNTGVNDSIVTKLSKPISTMFIWRWNNSEGMITYVNQMKNLSGYARSIIAQAQELTTIIKELKKLGNHSGLIHCIEGRSGPIYLTSAFDDKNDSLIFDYLNSFTESTLYDTYVKKSSEILPSWIPNQGNSSPLELSRNDFLSTFTTAKSLLSNSASSQYKHIVLITAGSAKNGTLKSYSDELNAITDSVTFTFKSAAWYGVDLQNTFSQKGLFLWRGYMFPSFSPVLIQLRIKSAIQPFSFSINQNTWGQPYTLSARVMSLWDTVFSWTGFDDAGVSTATIEEKPYLFKSHADSGIAKLWADDENHIAEKDEVYPGGTFGILTKATYFQATVENISDLDQSSIPFLSDEEIYAPRTRVVKTKITHFKPSIILRKGVLTIEAVKDYSILKIMDLSGKVILSIDLKKYKTVNGAYSIPLAALLQKFGKRKLLGILIGSSTQTFSIDIGGLR